MILIDCQSCGFRNQAGNKYCINCGHLIEYREYFQSIPEAKLDETLSKYPMLGFRYLEMLYENGKQREREMLSSAISIYLMKHIPFDKIKIWGLIIVAFILGMLISSFFDGIYYLKNSTPEIKINKITGSSWVLQKYNDKWFWRSIEEQNNQRISSRTGKK